MSESHKVYNKEIDIMLFRAIYALFALKRRHNDVIWCTRKNLTARARSLLSFEAFFFVVVSWLWQENI